MKINIFLSMATLLLILLLPKSSQAYFTTSQSAQQYGDKVLYTITYRFGLEKYDLYMPIASIRNVGIENKSTSLGYVLLDSKNATTTTIGKTSAIVLSKATIKDDQYFVPKGSSAEFTLVTLLDAKDIPKKSSVSLLVTSLPFTMILSDAVTLKARLNPSELKYYVTPKVTVK